MKSEFESLTIGEIIKRWEWCEDFFTIRDIDVFKFQNKTINQLTEDSVSETNEDYCDAINEEFIVFFNTLKPDTNETIDSIMVLPGKNKKGIPENGPFKMLAGEITAVVGPTGSGKSRLLEDIECLADKDTPTERKILINDSGPKEYNKKHNLIAYLSQNMNFIMDISVRDFLTMHAESRMIADAEEVTDVIFNAANELAGESFSSNTPITQLSGGQSRALMIADTALLSPAPIVLIDEIENAGIDKIRALKLLVKNNKIVLMSTHDPLLALSADHRVIIKNGGIEQVIDTTATEKKIIHKLREMDNCLSSLRYRLRNGKYIDHL